MHSIRIVSGRHSFVDIVRTVVAAAAFVATPIIVVLLSPMWRSGDITVGVMRFGAGLALMLPALLALAISLTNIEDWKSRLASAVIVPIGGAFIVAQMVDNPHSKLDDNPTLALIFACIVAGGALLGTLVGELLPRNIAQKAKDAIC